MDIDEKMHIFDTIITKKGANYGTSGQKGRDSGRIIV